MRIFRGYFPLMDSLTDGDGGAGAGKVDANNTTDSVDAQGNEPQVNLPSLPDNWYTALPEEHRGGMEAYRDIPTLVKTLVHAQGLVGRDKAVIPGKDATEEDWTNFYRQVGVPDSIEKYAEQLDLKEIPGAPPEITKSFQEFAFKNNLLPSQARAVVDWLKQSNEQVSEKEQEATTEQLSSRLAQLKGEWGHNYEANIEQAKSAFRAMGNKVPGIFEWAQDRGIAGDPMMIRVFQQINSLMKEGKIVDNQGESGATGGKAELDEIMANPAYWDKNDPKHKSLVRRSKELFSQVHSG